MAPNTKVEKKTNQTKVKESSALSVEDLDTFRRNLPISLGNQKKDTLPHFSDEESKEESKGEKENNMVSFKVRVGFKLNVQDDGEFNDEDLSDKDVDETCKLLYLNWKKQFISCEKQKEK